MPVFQPQLQQEEWKTPSPGVVERKSRIEAEPYRTSRPRRSLSLSNSGCVNLITTKMQGMVSKIVPNISTSNRFAIFADCRNQEDAAPKPQEKSTNLKTKNSLIYLSQAQSLLLTNKTPPIYVHGSII